MYQKDFILRMLEMLAELIAGVLGLIKKGDLEKATHVLNNAYHDLLKQDAVFFKNIPKDELNETLLKNHDYTDGHIEILAELFYAEGLLGEAKENWTESREYYEKALVLYNYISNSSSTFSFELQGKIAKLKNLIVKLEAK